MIGSKLKNRDVILVDLCCWKGHHKTYFLKIFQAIEDLGARVSGLCLDPDDFRNAFEEEPGNSTTPEVLTLEKPSRWLLGIVQIWNRLWHLFTGKAAVDSSYQVENLLMTKSSLRSAGVSANTLVFFLHLDSMLLTEPAWLGKVLMPRKWAGLYFIPSYRTLPEHARYKARARERVLDSKRCQGIYLLDEGAVADLKKKVNRGFVEYLPEPVNLECAHKHELPAPFAWKPREDSKIVGLFGNLDKRKNVLNLLRAFEQVEDSNLFLMLVGELDLNGYGQDEREEFFAITKKSANVFYRFEAIPEQEFNSLVAASDMLFLAYRDFVGSSNILVKAAHFQKPVVASTGWLIGERVEKYQLGLTVHQDNISGIAECLKNLSSGFDFNEDKVNAYMELNHADLLQQKLRYLCSKSRPNGEMAA